MALKEHKDRPSVILIITDDQRFDTIGALNNDEIHTPNLDFLARNGTSFTNAYLMGGSHHAVCMPSRAMMHTGRSLFHLQGEGQDIPAEHTTIGEHLRANGYTSFATGKWHNGRASHTRSFSGGAEIFFGGMDDHWNVPLCNYDPTGAYPAPQKHPWNPGTGTIEMVEKRFDHIHRGRHSTDIFADAAGRFLTAQDKGVPFFLNVAFMAPHDPRQMPQHYMTMYDPERIRVPDSFLPVHPFDNGEMEIRDEALSSRPRTPAEIRRHIAEYYAMLSHMDAAVGRILDALKASGRYDNTIIIHTADHGIALGRHGLMGKQNNYDHSLHIPLIMFGPGIPQRTLRDTLCLNIDIFPTICELLGLPTPPSVEGRSLAPALLDPTYVVRQMLLHAYKGVQRSVRNSRYKLIEYVVDGQRHTQLFDLIEDPRELADLAALPESGPTIAKLRNQMYAWKRDLDDPHEEYWRALGSSSSIE